MASDEKLNEPGAGWVNNEIELADLRASFAPVPSYMADGEKETREWIAALHSSDGIPEERCACGVMTKRHVVATVVGTPIREHAILLTRAQCPACADQWEAAQLRRSLAKPELLPRLREGYAARLAELERAQRSAA